MADLVVLITGASRGIGYAIAKALAPSVRALVLFARSSSELSVAGARCAQLGAKVMTRVCDITDRARVNACVDEAEAEFGRIDVLINNAAIQGPIGPFAECAVDDWVRAIEVDLLGVAFVTRRVLPGMRARRFGRIINLSGGGAVSPRPNFTAYASAKAAVVRFTECLAAEVSDDNIYVNAVAPGSANTRMLDEIVSAGVNAGRELEAASRQRDEGGTPGVLVSDLVVFLAADRAEGLSGKLISAQHDPWRDWAGRATELNKSPMFTSRRLDPHTIEQVSR